MVLSGIAALMPFSIIILRARYREDDEPMMAWGTESRERVNFLHSARLRLPKDHIEKFAEKEKRHSQSNVFESV